MTGGGSFVRRALQGVNPAQDLPSGLVVFLVALPLCLGIALASGAPLLAGIFAGVVGGLVIGPLSGSRISVSGPAAGLTVIVAAGIAQLGYPAFLAAVVLAGMIQLVFGFMRAGVVAHFVPGSVVRGMLAAIGLILILKQFPHAVGDDLVAEGDESFGSLTGRNTFTEIYDAVVSPDSGALLIFLASLGALLGWQRLGFKWLPAPLMAVLAGTLTNVAFGRWSPDRAVAGASHLVAIPQLTSVKELAYALPFPDYTRILDGAVWQVAVTLALVASIETLLSIKAADRLDPHHHITPTSRELKAQGIGNIASGLIGGLPLTSVIVRTSANVDAGAQSKLSTIVHGSLLLLSVVALAPLVNWIPLASLAAVLMVMGARLASPRLVREQWRRGSTQFVPFAATVLAILFTDLLIGILIGIGVGVFFVVRENFRSALIVTEDGESVMIRFAKDVSFLNKPSLVRAFEEVKPGSFVLIDGTHADFIDRDIREAIEDFLASAPRRRITAELRRSKAALNEYFKEPT